MPLSFSIKKHTLQFKVPAGTSRGTYTKKGSWYISIWEESNPEIVGVGEASPLTGLSIDQGPGFEQALKQHTKKLSAFNLPEDKEDVYRLVKGIVPYDMPALRFGMQSALLDLINGGKKEIFPGDFYQGKKSIPINGLIWMSGHDHMQQQIREKIEAGFNTIKIKVGAIDFNEECRLLEFIRRNFHEHEIVIRLDANGAFTPENALEKLQELSSFKVHSIEQPIKQGQWEVMMELCKASPIPIALDEELIGVTDKAVLLDTVKPQYIILKPTLHGGLSGSEEWISLSEERTIGWWITSALESNIGLNAIAQFTASYDQDIPQGLGTGQLFTNNIDSPLQIRKGELVYKTTVNWGSVS